MADTGFPDADAQADFSRARRRARFSKAVNRLRLQPDDISDVLPFDEVVDALGTTGQRPLGLQIVPVSAIVGSVDRARGFDRSFRPTSSQTRDRWARLNAAQRRGESLPPVQLRKIGDLYFVVDGHHRVSIARHRGDDDIEAYVTEILTKVTPEGIRSNRDLVLKDHRRVFLSRVPLSPDRADRIAVADPWKYTQLAECIEAWGFRLMQSEQCFLVRADVARRWFDSEFDPVVTAARAADLAPRHTDAELYLWVAEERYRLLRRHEWPTSVFTDVRRAAGRNEPPSSPRRV